MDRMQSLDALEQKVNWDSERALQPMGDLVRDVRGIFEALTSNDLRSSTAPKSIVVSLNKPTLFKLTRRLHDLLYNRLQVDVAKINEQVKRLESNATSSLGDENHYPKLELREVWERMENLVYLPEVPMGSLPRPSLAQVFGAGRQQIFVVLMFISLFARIGLDPTTLKGILGESSVILPMLSAMFTISLISIGVYAGISLYFSAQEEIKVGWEVELSRIRMYLEDEAIKVGEAAEKIKRTCFREYIKSLAKPQVRKPLVAQQASPLSSPKSMGPAGKVIESSLEVSLPTISSKGEAPIENQFAKPDSMPTKLPSMAELAANRKKRLQE